jgi:hypothetical protein
MTRRGFLALAALTACRSSRAPDPPEDALVDTAELGEGFIARQRVVARRGGESTAFEAVLQLRAGELLVLLLTPFGTKAHAILQRGREVEIQSFGAQLPFDPRHILVDVHRAFFVRLSTRALPDGAHRGYRDGARWTEHWQGGRVHERVFGRGRGRVRVVYPGGAAPGEWPRRVRLDDEGRGYGLDIETVEHTPLLPANKA